MLTHALRCDPLMAFIHTNVNIDLIKFHMHQIALQKTHSSVLGLQNIQKHSSSHLCKAEASQKMLSRVLQPLAGSNVSSESHPKRRLKVWISCLGYIMPCQSKWWASNAQCPPVLAIKCIGPSDRPFGITAMSRISWKASIMPVSSCSWPHLWANAAGNPSSLRHLAQAQVA